MLQVIVADCAGRTADTTCILSLVVIVLCLDFFLKNIGIIMIIIHCLPPKLLKAVIMAGGQGTRGRPYTEYFPKAMMPISDKPLVDYIIKYVQSFEFIDQIIIITDLRGLGGQILNYYGADSPSYDPTCMAFVQDSQSGTGGDLLHAYDMIPDNEPFVLWFVDNLCAVDLDAMLKKFNDTSSVACIATRSTRAEETGFAVVDDNDMVRKFVEKPTMSLPSSECLGVYILHHDVLSRISDVMQQKPSIDSSTRDIISNNGTSGHDTDLTIINCHKMQVNLSYDILEKLSKEGSVSAFDIGDSQWLDVESPTVLERNKTRVYKIISAMQ